MVKVRYKPNKHTLTLKGHAEYGEGSEIICASISMVYYNLCAMLRQYPPEAFIKPLEMKAATSKNGVTTIKCEPAKAYETWIDHDFLYALTGFETIQGNYPECLDLVVTQK